MSARCNDCTFCNEDLTVLSNLMTDMHARGNYRLANGLEKALRSCSTLQTKLKPDDRAYLETIARISKSDAWSIDDQTDLLMNAQKTIKLVKQISEPPQEPEPRPTGFTAMFTAARSSNLTPQYTEPETEERATSGFQAMILASCRGKREQPRAVVTRQLEYTFPDETHSRTPWGFGEMLEAAFPHGNRTTPDNKARVMHRSMGFAAMLEGARRGTE